MFEDKRFNNEINNDNNYVPKDNYGINDNLGNDNLSFTSYSYVPEPEPINKKPKKEKNYKWVKYLLISLIGIILIVVSLVIILKVISSPTKIYDKYINYTYNYLKNYVKKLENNSLSYDISEDSMILYGNLKLDSSDTYLKDFKKYTFDYNLGLDVKNEKIHALVALKENSKSLIDFNGYILNDNLLVKSNKLFDKLINVSEIENLDFNDLKSNYSYDVILDILSFLSNYFNHNLNKDKLYKETETLNIDNENYKVNSNVYSLSESDVRNEFIKIIDAVINDDSTLRAVSNILNVTRKEAKEYLVELKTNDEVLDNLKRLKFKIYTEGLANKFIGFSLFYNDAELIRLTSVNELVIDINYNELEFNIVKNNENIEIFIYQDDDEILNALVTIQDEVTNIELNSNYNEMDINANISYVLNRIGNKRQTLNLKLAFDIIVEEEKFDLSLEFNNTTQIGDKVANVNTSSVVKLEELTEEDMTTIENNFIKTFENTPFKSLFDSLKSNIENNALCSMATDCICENEICTCKYLDNDGIVQSVTCQK